METLLTTPARDPQLWRQAQCRARFKSHLFTYVLVNALLWLIWGVTDHGHHDLLPWPAWSTIFWGIGVLAQGLRTYGGWTKHGLAEREYERLMRQQSADGLR
jgi:hypothetical protein